MADDDQASPDEKEISRRDNEIEKVVVSDTLTPDDTDPWRDTIRIVRRADVHAELTAMKQANGNEILIFAGHTLWNDLLAEGLVDELHLMIGAVVIGNGVRAFEVPSTATLRLLDANQLEGSETVLVKYEVRSG